MSDIQYSAFLVTLDKNLHGSFCVFSPSGFMNTRPGNPRILFVPGKSRLDLFKNKDLSWKYSAHSQLFNRFCAIYRVTECGDTGFSRALLDNL